VAGPQVASGLVRQVDGVELARQHLGQVRGFALSQAAHHLRLLRAAGVVVEVRFLIIGRTWITTTAELAGRVLKDSETFTMRKDGRVAGLRWWMPGWIRTLAVSMLTMDEPDQAPA
jgi:hypothetical protein